MTLVFLLFGVLTGIARPAAKLAWRLQPAYSWPPARVAGPLPGGTMQRPAIPAPMDAARELFACELCVAAPWWSAMLLSTPGWPARGTALKENTQRQAEAFALYATILRDAFGGVAAYHESHVVNLASCLANDMDAFAAALRGISCMVARVVELSARADRIESYSTDPWFARFAEKTAQLGISARGECTQIAAFFEVRYPLLREALCSSKVD